MKTLFIAAWTVLTLGTAAAAMPLTADLSEQSPSTSRGMRARLNVEKIDPPYWWTGMENDTLQLLISGPAVGTVPLTVDYPGVTVIEDVEGVSPDYKIVYLTLGKETRPGKMELRLGSGRKSTVVPYELKERTWSGADNPGFDASDVLYLIMPDRFADGDPANNALPMREPYQVDRSSGDQRHGGDIKGISDHLDYIDSLGVTAIWVNPVLENDMRGGSYHGYATTDYYRIDPRFGSNEQWAEFVDDAHHRGIKVVMDMIFNHSGSSHPWMAQAPMADWYNHPDGDLMTNFRLSTLHDPYASDYDRESTVNGWFVPVMPDLNQRNPHLMNYLIQNSIFWIEDSKIDGIRMDTYPYADMNAMARWIAAVEREYPDFTIVGECWYPTPAGEAFWQRGTKVNPVDPNLKTVMDFMLTLDNGNAAFFEPTEGMYGLYKLYDHLALDFLYPDPQNILTFLDNHDTDRFLRRHADNLDSWKQAQTFLLTSRGIPQIYYGTEILMDGNRADGGDGNVRRDMPGGFPNDSLSVFTPGAMTPLQTEAFDFLSRLLHWRKGPANDVIARGSLKHFIPLDGIYVYERRLGDKQIVVVMNGLDEENIVDMTRTAEVLPIGAVLRDFLTGSDIAIDPEMSFTPRQILILTNF